MKRLITMVIIVLAVAVAMAQAPEKFTYQAVVRNASNTLVANAQVGVRVNILQGSATGNAVYSESHVTSSNANGLITVNIGDGYVLHGSFAGIDWSDGPYFLKTDIDPNGGNDYSITSTQQLLSVPYALYAKEAGNSFSGDYNDLTNTPTIPTVPTNVSAFTNDAGYLTEYTEQQVLSISNDTLFLTGGSYVKLPAGFDGDYNSLTNKPTIPTVPTNVSAFTNDAGYITGTDIPEIPTVPTNVSAFANDAGYLTEYTEQQVLSISNDTLFLTGGSFVKLPAGFDGDYNSLTNKPTIPTVPTNVSAFTNDAGYITGTDIPAIPTVPTNVSAFTNDAGYLTEYTEQQVLSISNDTLFLTGGSFVKLPAGFDGDYNSLTNKPTIPTVPTNVSAFTNDAGYITGTDIPAIPTVPTNVSAFTNDAGYLITYTETDPQFNAWDKDYNDLTNKPVLFDGNYNSLSNKPVLFDGDYNSLTNQPTIPTVPTNVSSFTNDVGYITKDSVPTNVSAFANDAGYLTEAACNGVAICEMLNTLAELQNQVDSLQQSSVTSEAQGMTPTVTTAAVSDIAATSATCGGEVTSDGGSVVVAKGVCWNTTGAPTISDSHTIDGGGMGPFLSDLQALTPGTIYFVRAYATNSMGTTYGEEITYATTFTCGYNLIDGINTYTTQQYGIQCWMTQNLRDVTDILQPCPSGWHLPNNDEWNALGTHLPSSPVNFGNGHYLCAMPWQQYTLFADFCVQSNNVTPTGSACEAHDYANGNCMTNYYPLSIRCVRDENGVVVTAQAPAVTTAAVSDIAATSATCGGEVTSDSGSVVIAKGVCWNTTGIPTVSGNHTIDGGGTGFFVSNLQALTPGTTYFVRAYATSGAGTAYGDEITFTTAAEETVEQGMTPAVTTAAVSDIAATSATCGGEVTSDSGSVVIAKGVCWNTTGIPTVSGNHTIDGGGTGFFVSNLQVLSPGTTYFVRAYATNNTGTAYGDEITFTTAAEETVEQGMTPTVTTAAVSDIAATSATCGGEVTSDSGSVVIAKGVCWNTTGIPTVSGNHTIDGGGTGFFVSNLQALSPGTTYFVRAYATNNTGTAYGEEITFTTAAEETVEQGMTPTVTTAAVSDIAATSATCGGEVTSDGESVVMAKGVCWNTTGNPTISGNHTISGGGTGGFVSDLQALTPSTTYFVRAYATNNTGTAYGEEITFTTAAEETVEQGMTPTVTTAAVSDIAATSATCGGEVTSDGGSVVVAKGVCWNTTGAPTISDNHTIDGGGTGAFLSDLQPLTSGMTYFVRAYATNSAGTAYGEEVPFMITFTCGGNLVDGSDSYTTSAYGSQCWMTQNLRKANGSELFSWVDASHSCPAGWHLPTAAEWDVLANYVNTNSAQDSNIPLFFAHIGYEYWVDMTMPWQDIEGIPHTLSEPCCINGQHINSGCTIAYDIDAGVAVNVRCVRDMEEERALPTVTTAAVSDIAATSATCGGEVTSDGGSVVMAKGVCWNTTGAPTISDNHTIDGGGTGAFLSDLQPLTSGMTYFVRAYATNSAGTAYGEEVTFMMAFTCGSNLIDGNNSYTTSAYGSQCWMTQNLRKANGSELFSWVEASHSCPAGWHLPTAAEWDVLANYVNTNSAQDSNIPLFFAHIGSEYWVDMTMPYQTPDGSQYTVSALCCINGQQINSNCGIAAEINTHSNPVRCVREVEVDQVLPTVMTTAVPNITATSVTCGGEVISDGGSVVTAKGVCWNTTGFPTISDNHTIAGGGIGPFFSELQGLILGKTYYLRSYAINSTGISYGLQVSFTVTGYDYQTWDGAGPNPNDALPCQGAATVTDHEGNVYNTVQIGNQCWTRENMRCTTSPSTGTTILEYPASSYSYTGKKAYYVNGSAENSSTYGLLYNWNAAMDTFNTVYGETSTDTNYNHTVDVTFSDSRRGICPSGWHVPNKAEWSQLNDYVESQNKELFTFSESNPTGFSVLLAGVYDQDYAEFGYNARFWTTAQSSPRKACSFWSVGFCCTTTKFVGVPVRCLRDY